MRKIAIINQKGGSGKTTTAVSLAAALAEKRKKVLFIDLDSQATATNWLGHNVIDKSLLSLFEENLNINNIIKDTEIKNLKIIPASSQLINLEKILSNDKNPNASLKNQLDALNESNRDYVIIDCPPTLSFLTVNILAACHEVIIPVESRILAISSLVKLLETINIVKNRLNNNLKVAGIVICRVDTRTRHSKEMIDAMKNKFDTLTYKTFIRENVTLPESLYFNKTIFQYDPQSIGAQDYRALTKEIINQEESYFMNLAVKQKIQQKNLQ